MDPRKSPKPKLTAEAAYENAHLVAQDLLEHLRELLFDMPAPGTDNHPIHWGHVGNINRINTLLVEAVTFLDRTEK